MNLDARSARPRGAALPRHRRRHRGRHRGGTARARRPSAAAARARPPARARFHDRRARLCRGGQARSDRVGRRPRHLRSSQSDGARRSRTAPLARRLHHEHAAGARRPRVARAHARRASPASRRISTRCCATRASAARRSTATPPRPGSAAARWCPRRSAVRDARARMARWSASSACWPRRARRSCAKRSPIPACARSRRNSACVWSASPPTATASFPRRSTRRSAPTRRKPSTSTRHCRIRRRSRSPNAAATRSARWRAGATCRSSRTTPTASSRPTGRRRSPPSRPISAGISPGLAKCIGAGLRLAYVVAPDSRSGWSFNAAMRALCVMASPISAAVATRWINDGTADTILRFIRAESMARERIAAKWLEPGAYLSDPAELQYLAAAAQRLDALGVRQPVRGPRDWASCPATPLSPPAFRPRPCASASVARSPVRRSSADWSLSRIRWRQARGRRFVSGAGGCAG